MMDIIMSEEGHSLFSEGFLTERDRKVTLNGELLLHFPEAITSRFNDLSNSENEVGGLLICSPARDEKGNKSLEVIGIVEIPSLHPDPDRYIMDLELAQKAVDEWARKERIIPITFHTHPLPSRGDYFEMFHFYYQAEPSDEDIKYLHRFKVLLYGRLFHLPDVLIVGEGFRDRISVTAYGLGYEYGSQHQCWIIKKKGLQTIAKGAKEIFDGRWKKLDNWVKGLIGGIVVAFAFICIYCYISYPRFRRMIDGLLRLIVEITVLETTNHVFTRECTMALEENNYFKQAIPGSSVKIYLPGDDEIEDKELLDDIKRLGE